MRWKNFRDHPKWQRQRIALFEYLENHSVIEAANRFRMSRSAVYQKIAKRKRNPQFGRAP